MIKLALYILFISPQRLVPLIASSFSLLAKVSYAINFTEILRLKIRPICTQWTIDIDMRFNPWIRTSNGKLSVSFCKISNKHNLPSAEHMCAGERKEFTPCPPTNTTLKCAGFGNSDELAISLVSLFLPYIELDHLHWTYHPSRI